MKTKQGFTILEILLFVLVVGIALVPLISLFGNVLHSSAGRQSIQKASFLAQGLMEEISAMDFEDIRDPDVANSPLNKVKTSFNARHYPFTSDITVYYVMWQDFNMEAEEEEKPTDFKRVKATVKWHGRQVELVTIAAKTDDEN